MQERSICKYSMDINCSTEVKPPSLQLGHGHCSRQSSASSPTSSSSLSSTSSSSRTPVQLLAQPGTHLRLQNQSSVAN